MEPSLNAEDESIKDVVFSFPDYKSEFEDAKTFLQKVSPYSGDNLYDHLSDCLNKILAERPENVIDFFEEYSRKVKEQRYKPLTDHLQDIYIEPLRFQYMMKIMPFLRPSIKNELEPSTADPEEEDFTDPSKRDLLEFAYYYEKAGIGMPKTELYCLELSMKQLAKSEKLQDIRFWGKIYGLYKNYYVLEAEPNEEEKIRRNTPLEEEEEKFTEGEPPADDMRDALADVEKQQEMYGEEEERPQTKYPRPKPPVPVPIVKITPRVPNEPCGEGVNRKVYYVCNELGDIWTLLPDVTPEQIVVARQITKYFTGSLETMIISYPHFPGVELNLLRAQIARISAGTQISPLGYFTFGGGGGGEEEEEEEEEEGEEEEGGGGKTNYKVNKKYEPHSITDITDPSLSFWVHHTQFILPQGRTRWWNPYPKSGGGGEEEEMGEEEEEEGGGDEERAEPETGPALLTPASEDASLEAIAPWSVRSTSVLLPERAIAVVRSNLWPGAYAVTGDKFFENIYIGTGQKHAAHNYSPVPLPEIQEEYPLGPEILEITDPTAQMEEEWRIAHEKIELPKGEEEVGAEEEAEEEEEEEDDE